MDESFSLRFSVLSEKKRKDDSDYESSELNFENGDVIRGQVLRLTRESERSTVDETIYFVDENDEFLSFSFLSEFVRIRVKKLPFVDRKCDIIKIWKKSQIQCFLCLAFCVN